MSIPTRWAPRTASTASGWSCPTTDWYRLRDLAPSLGLEFMGSAWDRGSADLLDALDTPAIKTPSAVLTDLDLLEYIARKGRPMIVSTGMSTLEEVDQAVERILRHTDQLILLQCTSAYPSEFADINLRVMDTYRAALRRAGRLLGPRARYRRQRSGRDARRVRRRAALHARPHAARARPRGVARADRTGKTRARHPPDRSGHGLGRKTHRAVRGAGAHAPGQERRRRAAHSGGRRGARRDADRESPGRWHSRPITWRS